MQEKAFEGIYIGYDLLSESHKILNIKTGKIICTVNVRIDDKTNNKKIKLSQQKVSEEKPTDKIVLKEILPLNEALPVPDTIKDNTSPDISENPATDEHPVIQNENLSIINVTNKTIKEKDLSIPKNISHAFKCDESEQWIKSTLREVNAMIENDV